MSTKLPLFLDEFRNPEYTGENRCTPCTLVNVLIAFAVAFGISRVVSPLVGVVALGIELLLVAFRGYLVPGTPTLTKRYFPDWLLAWFDKGPERPADQALDVATELDPETLLSEADAVEPCADEDDLCLTASFEAAWQDEIDRLQEENARRDALSAVFEIDSVSVDATPHGVSVSAEQDLVGRWPSVGALVADLAGDRALAARTAAWTDLPAEQRFGVLAGLRSFLDSCPLCGAPVVVSETTAESCCRSWEVLLIHCTDCQAELLEVDPETLETVA